MLMCAAGFITLKTVYVHWVDANSVDWFDMINAKRPHIWSVALEKGCDFSHGILDGLKWLANKMIPSKKGLHEGA